MITFRGQQFDDWAAARAAMLIPDADPAPAVAVADATEEPMPPAPMIERPAVEPKRRPLAVKYRPRTLAELAGQPDVVAVLRDFAGEPYSWPFILAGETGTGKTSAAWALAADLGCNIDADPAEFGGVYSIASGEHNADSVRDIWPKLWSTPFDSARGWKVLIVNEVEAVSALVERLWLDKLEDLPPRTVIVFTTNAVESLPTRFRDRCTVLAFEAAADRLDGPARDLARQIWRQETGAECPAAALNQIVERATQAGRVSFRRVVQNIAPMLARQKGG